MKIKFVLLPLLISLLSPFVPARAMSEPDVLAQVVAKIESINTKDDVVINYRSKTSSNTMFYSNYQQTLYVTERYIRSRGSSSTFEYYQPLNYLITDKAMYYPVNYIYSMLNNMDGYSGYLSKDFTLANNLTTPNGSRLDLAQRNKWLEIPETLLSDKPYIVALRGDYRNERSNGIVNNLKESFYTPARDAILTSKKLSDERYLLTTSDRTYLYTFTKERVALSIATLEKGYNFHLSLTYKKVNPYLPSNKAIIA